MRIKRTFKRKTNNNDYSRYFIEDGLKCWYVNCNHGEITSVVERLYHSDMENIVYEKRILYLPNEIISELNKIK